MNKKKVKLALENANGKAKLNGRKRSKSVAQVNAGKAKVHTIAKWPQACKLARQQLIQDGKPVPSCPAKGTAYHKLALDIFKKL